MQCFMRGPQRHPAIAGGHDKELALRWKKILNASDPFERAPPEGRKVVKSV